MRLTRMVNSRRAGWRGRYDVDSLSPALRAWAQAWLSACGQLAAARWVWEQRQPLAEIALYVGAYLVYVLSRGIVYDDPRSVGIFNGDRIADFQAKLGFLWEPGWQSWAIEHVHGIVVFLNWAYVITYWPVILALAFILFLRNRRRYYYFRTVVLLDLIVALLAFMLFPVASPFAIPGVGLIDTIQAYGPTFYGTETMANFYNTSAAMPSLHFSWTVILGVYCWLALPGGFKAVGLLYPVMTFFAITVTGNHFILDAVVGGVLAGLSFGAVEAYRHLSPRLRVAGAPVVRWAKRVRSGASAQRVDA